MSNEKSLYILFEKRGGPNDLGDQELIDTMTHNIAMLLAHLDLAPCNLEDRVERLVDEPFSEAEVEALRTGKQMKLTLSWIDDTEAEFKQLLGPTEHTNL